MTLTGGIIAWLKEMGEGWPRNEWGFIKAAKMVKAAKIMICVMMTALMGGKGIDGAKREERRAWASYVKSEVVAEKA
jgi:hypothetical protein